LLEDDGPSSDTASGVILRTAATSLSNLIPVVCIQIKDICITCNNECLLNEYDHVTKKCAMCQMIPDPGLGRGGIPAPANKVEALQATDAQDAIGAVATVRPDDVTEEEAEKLMLSLQALLLAGAAVNVHGSSSYVFV
jgi:hypothetical protein